MSSKLQLLAMVSAVAIGVGSFYVEPAHAQAPVADGDTGGQDAQSGGPTSSARDVGEIVVTGSRIQATGMVTATPVTAISASDINRMAPGDVTEALDRLPAFVNSTSTSDDATSGVSDAGGTNLNLRGLGTSRTLTLLNGRRVVPNNKEGAVNIDIFPSGIVQRVDIVTGGASAAYGTDAVAGVVNFILDTKYEGLKGNAQTGITERGDNFNYLAGLTWGVGLGERLHLVLSGEYSKEDGIGSFKGRDWYRSGSLISNASGRPTNITAFNVVGTNFTCGGLISAPGRSINNLEFLPGGGFAPFVRSPVSATGAGTNNAQSLASGPGSGCDSFNTIITADQEKGRLYGHLTYEASDNVKFFAEGIWAHDEANLGGSQATMVPPQQATIFSGNAFLPTAIQTAMTRENIASFGLATEISELFPDNETLLRNRTMSITGGVDIDFKTGGFFDDWHLSAYYSYGKNKQRAQFFGKERQDRVYLAVDAVRDGAGNIVCRAALLNPSRFGGCAPLNLFSEGLASQSAIDYVTSPRRGEADIVTFFYDLVQHNTEAAFSGNLFEGWGAGPISAAVGASYRKQSLSSRETGLGAMFDTPRNGELGVRGIPAAISGDPDIHLFDSFSLVNGGFNVKEGFAELNVPLIVDRPLFEKVVLNAAVRVADYSGSGTIWSYKAGLDWQVIPDIRLRGTYSRDVRAATLSEQFDVQRTNGSIAPDPVTGNSYNFSQTTGGNPNVAPEKADSLTAGVVLQPSFLPGLSVSADYWRINISGAIGQLGPQRIADQCFAGAAGLCDLITRDPTTNVITDLRNIFININKEIASGVDFEVDYRTRIGGDQKLTVRALGSWLLERAILVPGAPKEDLLGQYAQILSGDFFSYPELQGTLNLTYENGPFSLFLQERYIHSGKLRNTYVEGVDVDDNHVPAVVYTDLGVTWRIEQGGRNVEFFGFATNLLDRNPPLAPQPFTALNGSVQTNRQLYDVRGRRFQFGIRFDL
jgi:iron complex outermembrane receptor protein